MRIELRNDSVLIDGYVNAVGRDSNVMRDRETGQRFVEQVVPGAFQRALGRNEVQLLLDHDPKRVLGSTETNLKLHEDAIGLRASAEITDPEVVQKARKKKLRGWSFGFHERDAREEDVSDRLKRRFVEDMELVEVSIIDEKKIPCYDGTSIETRAKGKETVTYEPLETRAVYAGEGKLLQETDYESYKKRIKKLEGK